MLSNQLFAEFVPCASQHCTRGDIDGTCPCIQQIEETQRFQTVLAATFSLCKDQKSNFALRKYAKLPNYI